MGNRKDLQHTLESVDSELHVYYHPPSNVQLQYPCLVYQLERIRQVMGNNRPYLRNRSYSALLITQGPNDDLVDKILDLPYVRHNRSYRADNLQHESFTIHY